MTRYILIDNASGYIFGDTADLPRHTFAGDEFPVDQNSLTPQDAARWLDETVVKDFGRSYECHSRAPDSNTMGYLVYRADINGSDAVPVVQDGQSRETIKAVERDCKFVCFVEATRRPDL